MRKLGIVFVILGALLVSGALLLLFMNKSEDEAAGETARETLESIKELIVTLPTEEPVHVDRFNEEEVLRSYNMRVVNVDGSGYIGYISIPKLGIELPVMSELDSEKLKTSPCRMTGSVKSGDMIIAGHNYKRHFGGLKDLLIGDAAYFTDMNGRVRTYLVSELLILEPTDIDGMMAGDWDLTLFTCTYGGAQRVTVRLVEIRDAGGDILRY